METVVIIIGIRGWFKLKRWERGMTQAELAERVGVSVQTISGIETGKRNPSPKLANRLAKELNFDMRLFFPDEDSA